MLVLLVFLDLPAKKAPKVFVVKLVLLAVLVSPALLDPLALLARRVHLVLMVLL